MPKFNIIVAHNVPHYGTVEIEARDPDHALEVLKQKNLSGILDEAVLDPAWDSSNCARIVYMQDEQGNVFHEDTALDQSYREWSAVGDLIEAIKSLLGDRPTVQGGICQCCGRDYIGDFLEGDCPSDDCPSSIARAAIVKATGGASCPPWSRF